MLKISLCILALLGWGAITWADNWPPGRGRRPELIPDGDPVLIITSLPYAPTVPPNPALSWGTVAIRATKPNVTMAEAAGLARFASNQYKKTGRWSRFTVFVIQDPAAEKTFGTYMARRRGKPLMAADMPKLSAVWPKALACYQYSGKQEWISYPFRNPRNWWMKGWTAPK